MHCAKLISHLNNKTHLTRCEQATFYQTKILFHHSNHEGRTRRWLDSTATLSRENAAIFLCSWATPLCSLHQLASTRYAAHPTWCQAGSPQWFTRLPSHRLLQCPGISTESRRISHRGKQAGELNGISTNHEQVAVWTSRSVFVLTLQCQWTKKAVKDRNLTDIIGSGFWQSCGSIHTHWHTSLSHCTTSWMEK